MFCTREETNTETSLENCLNLEDRLTLAEKLHLHELLGFASVRQLRRWSKELKPFRNAVAHGSGVLDAKPDPVDAIEFMVDLRCRCEMVWEHVEPNN
ncbi:hypothetical protein [Demequina sediminicola]|uniref:hypothetical protein n=1 Tax=Demequina sediminicola TaxID=1095026 RepID=UPI000784864F|nr:hypothetical protein [Demequina sediminicola]